MKFLHALASFLGILFASLALAYLEGLVNGTAPGEPYVKDGDF